VPQIKNGSQNAARMQSSRILKSNTQNNKRQINIVSKSRQMFMYPFLLGIPNCVCLPKSPGAPEDNTLSIILLMNINILKTS